MAAPVDGGATPIGWIATAWELLRGLPTGDRIPRAPESDDPYPENNPYLPGGIYAPTDITPGDFVSDLPPSSGPPSTVPIDSIPGGEFLPEPVPRVRDRGAGEVEIPTGDEEYPYNVYPENSYPPTLRLPRDHPGREYLPSESPPGVPGTDTWCEQYPDLCLIDTNDWQGVPIFGLGVPARPQPQRRAPPRRRRAPPPKRAPPRRPPRPRLPPNIPDLPGDPKGRPPRWFPPLPRFWPFLIVWPNTTAPDDVRWIPADEGARSPVYQPPTPKRTRPRVLLLPPDERERPAPYVPPQPRIPPGSIPEQPFPTLPEYAMPPSARPAPRVPPASSPGSRTSPRAAPLALPSLPPYLPLPLPSTRPGRRTAPTPSFPLVGNPFVPDPLIPAAPIPLSPAIPSSPGPSPTPLTPLQPGVLDLPVMPPIPKEDLDRCRDALRRRKKTRECIERDDCGRCKKFRKL